MDVIAAAATAWGESAIGIVRMSGEGCCDLVCRFFRSARPLAEEPPRKMVLGEILDVSGESGESDESGGGAVVDRVLAVRFERGASYTGEESVEVHCHGGSAAVRKCLDLFIGGGARMADPGEFTKRAFLSGRLDLAQAEAVLGVIRARSDEALSSSGRSLQGGLSRMVRKLADSLTELRAELEVRIDYPEEIDDGELSELAEGIESVAGETRRLIERCRVGAMLDNGLRVAIIGRPNVGKSSLLNAICGSDRAIVAETPGTTRDTVEVSLVHRGMPMCFIDTAGIREEPGEIESMGIARARIAAESADIALLVVDASEGICGEDIEACEAAGCKRIVLVFNKSDLPAADGAIKTPETIGFGRVERVMRVSALTGDGMEGLMDEVFHIAVGGVPLGEGFAATERIVEALGEAVRSIEEAGAALISGGGVDVAGSLLGEASYSMASVLGADATEELLDRIFSNFCVGK